MKPKKGGEEKEADIDEKKGEWAAAENPSKSGKNSQKKVLILWSCAARLVSITRRAGGLGSRGSTLPVLVRRTQSTRRRLHTDLSNYSTPLF